MDILYAIDKKFLDIAMASLYSLFTNSNIDNIRLHIVTANFSESDIRKLENFISQFPNVLLNIYKLEDNPIDDYNIPDFRGVQISNARLFYPRIIKERFNNINNLLYLDADTIVIDDLNGFNDYNNNTINACKESSLKSYYEKFDINNYYNTGVLYFNVDRLLSLDIEDRIKDFLKNNEIKLCYPDQDILNVILKDEINSIPIRYNMVPYTFALSDSYLKYFYNDKYRQLGYEEIIKEKEEAKILHSAGLCNIKPWHINNINPYNELFMKYMNKVNPSFNKQELSFIKKMLAVNPSFTYTLLMLRTYLPDNINELGSKLSLKIQQK